MKKNKIEEIVKTIPNSVSKNEANQQNKFEIVSIKELKEKENQNKMLSTKVLVKLTKEDDIPASFLVIDSEGNFMSVSIYNMKKDTLDAKVKKDALLSIMDPFVKKVNFEGFTYFSVQCFDFTKIWADKKGFVHSDFNPNTVYNETFEK
jgi:uncharacterized protein (DUF2461 family)